MAKFFKDCCKEVDLDPVINVPDQEIMWYAYDNGKVIKCDTQKEAKKYKLYEKVLDTDSKERVTAYWKDRSDKEAKAAEIFRASIREDYPEMSNEMFELCYRGAFDTKKSADYEEIPDLVKYFAMFAHKAINTSKKDVEFASDVETENTESVDDSETSDEVTESVDVVDEEHQSE